ncbi:hypothetical protein QL996_04165 [Planococcus sp. APC 4015]|nr:hypothetical protein [Planococcus sp. APC 4015]
MSSDTPIEVGCIIPSTNTIVERDYARIGARSVVFHYGRSHIQIPDIDSDEAFERLIAEIEAGNAAAIERVSTAQVSYMTMGMSSETFWGGKEGNARFEAEIVERAGVPITTGATALRAALDLFGARKIAYVSPYPEVGNRHVTRYFTEHGFDVVAQHGLASDSPKAMSEVDDTELARVIAELDAARPDAILQVGTNLSMIALAASAEDFLRKPVIAINAACVWHTLRQVGSTEQIDGFGSLLRDH